MGNNIEWIEHKAVVWDWIDNPDGAMRLIELAGRVCYASERKQDNNTHKKFLRKLNKLKHSSVFEHRSITIEFITDRATAMQILRHRLVSYSMLSQRYTKEVKLVSPLFSTKLDNLKALSLEKKIRKSSEKSVNKYYELLGDLSPQDARMVLPSNTATKLIATYNFRQLRNIFLQRCKPEAQRPIRELMQTVLEHCIKHYNPMFHDLEYLLKK